MKFKNIREPHKKIENANTMTGQYIAPIKRLEIVSPEDFEDMIAEWAFGYLSEEYDDIYRIGGSGDKGRDVIGIRKDKKNDIYQCKHYSTSLSASHMWIEFGKLIYYTYNNDYDVPSNYYIVTTKKVSPSLLELVANPNEIKEGLLKNWSSKCKTKISKKIEIKMNVSLKEYIEKFDFSIITILSPYKFIEQYRKTKWFKYRFGEIEKRRPDRIGKIPQTLDSRERLLPYIDQLFKAYKERSGLNISSMLDLEMHPNYEDHFKRQRRSYFSSQALMRFARDEYIDDPYNSIKDEILFSVKDTSLENYLDNYERMNKTLSEARKTLIESNDLGIISPIDKNGICHDLVNDKELEWVKSNENE